MGRKSKTKGSRRNNFVPLDLGKNHPFTNGSGCSPTTLVNSTPSPWNTSHNSTCSLSDIQAEQQIISDREAKQRRIDEDNAAEQKRLKMLRDKQRIAQIFREEFADCPMNNRPTMQEVALQQRFAVWQKKGHETMRIMFMKYPSLASNEEVKKIVLSAANDPMAIWSNPLLLQYKKEAEQIYYKK